MSICPYTWMRSLFSSPCEKGSALAQNLHVRVIKNNEEVVRVALPAQSARWLIELIPQDVVDKIRAERIPLDDVLVELQTQSELFPREIFRLTEIGREVHVWLE